MLFELIVWTSEAKPPVSRNLQRSSDGNQPAEFCSGVASMTEGTKTPMVTSTVMCMIETSFNEAIGGSEKAGCSLVENLPGPKEGRLRLGRHGTGEVGDETFEFLTDEPARQLRIMSLRCRSQDVYGGTRRSGERFHGGEVVEISSFIFLGSIERKAINKRLSREFCRSRKRGSRTRTNLRGLSRTATEKARGNPGVL